MQAHRIDAYAAFAVIGAIAVRPCSVALKWSCVQSSIWLDFLMLRIIIM